MTTTADLLAVAGLHATASLLGRRIDLAWRNPPAEAFGGDTFVGIRVVRRTRFFPRGPTDGVVVDLPVTTRHADAGLAPLTTYYYVVYAVSQGAVPPPTYHESPASRASAFATDDFGLPERLYRMLPAVHQRLDAPLGAADVARLNVVNPVAVAALDALPPALRARGQLRRFLAAAAAPLDLVRSLAEGLPQLRDPDEVRADFLPLLADWLGWELDRTVDVYRQRSEVRLAPRLARSIGTIPALRATVARYTGWRLQVAEYAQQIARSNLAPALNVFAVVEDPGTGRWRATDDAAAVLGFGPGNDAAVAPGPNTPAPLSGSAGPFALRPGMELSITADDGLPSVVRFMPDDFLDDVGSMDAATAAQVAAVIDRELLEVRAAPYALPLNKTGVRITSNRADASSALRIDAAAASLVTLEGAPRGRLAVTTDASSGGAADRVRLLYESADPLEPLVAHEASEAFRGVPHPRLLATGADGAATTLVAPPRALGRIRYKTLRGGAWSASRPLDEGATAPRRDPAVVTLPDGRLWCAWVEQAESGPLGRLRFRVEQAKRGPTPATLRGRRTAPFDVRAGLRLVLRGRGGLTEGFRFESGDIALAGAATAAEVASALNARLDHFTATVVSGTIAIASAKSGGDERVRVDGRHSTAAAALGLDVDVAALGEWGDEIAWGAPQPVLAGDPWGRYADLHAVATTTGGATVWLFWSWHDGTRWRIQCATWNVAAAAWSVTDTLTNSLGGDREPAAAVDAAGQVWLCFARRQIQTRPEEEGSWTLMRRTHPGTPGGPWGGFKAVTTLPPAPARAADRQPAIVRLATNVLRIYFNSDRAGGSDLWSITLDPVTEVLGAAAPLFVGAPSDQWPAPLMLPGSGAAWLLFRSDRSVPLAQVATAAPPRVDPRILDPAPTVQGGARSLLVPDAGTVRRHAGAISLAPDPARLGQRRAFDDLLSYTPERPQTPIPRATAGDALLPDPDIPRYTRGTVGLYLSPPTPGATLAPQVRERLQGLLDRVLPINIRAVVDITPRTTVEYVYSPKTDIGESYSDRFPYVEALGGVAESVVAAEPVAVLYSAAPADPIPGVTADPADLTAPARRTLFPPTRVTEALMPSTDYPTGELHGMYHDVVRDGLGNVVFDSGWRRNVILDGFRRVLASFVRGPSVVAPSSDALGIQGIQLGFGLPVWDTTALPAPDATRTTLYDANPFFLSMAAPPQNSSIAIEFLQGGATSAVPTSRLQIKVTIGPKPAAAVNTPPWPDGPHPSATLREFGLVGRLNGADVLLNHVTHPAILKDPASTIDRTIWLVF